MEQPPNTLTKDPRAGEALSVRRLFTQAGRPSVRHRRVGAAHGRGRLVPRRTTSSSRRTWSQNSTNIVAQKYFRGQLDSPTRERSVKQMIGRVSGTIADWGRERGYFASVEDGDAFEAELTYILLHQMAAFNSPVWFNVGFEEQPQCSRLLHPLGRGHDGLDPRLEHARGQDLPRRLRLGHQPLEDPRLDGAAVQGRHRERPGLVHARRRRVGGHDQVRRQDAPRGEDGRARRRPPRTSASSSGARPRRRTRPPRCATPASTCRSTATASPRSSTRTPTTRSASPTSSCTPSRTTRTGALTSRADRRAGRRADPRARADARDRRGRLALRRSGRAVRHDDQPVAHVAELGPHQRVQPVLGVHARRRLGVQPRVAEPDEVPPAGRHVRRRRASSTRSTSCCSRRRSSSARRATRREEIGRNARAFRQLGLGYANLGAYLMSNGLRVRLRRGPRHRRRDHRADDRPRLPAVGEDRRGDRARTTATRRTARRTTTSCGCTATRRTRSRTPPSATRRCSPRRARRGTRPSRSASSTATATRRRRCSPPRARSRS